VKEIIGKLTHRLNVRTSGLRSQTRPDIWKWNSNHCRK